MIEQHELEIEMEAMKRMEFFIEISKYLEQGSINLRPVFLFFKDKSLSDRLTDY